MTSHTANYHTKLSDRLEEDLGWYYMTGMQALVRLPIQQRRRDAARGLNTGGYISGYRGSPLGRYDVELWQAEAQLAEHNIVFQPGVNEDLAATAAWGSQLVGAFPGARVDGVFSIWYGKAPGMDRSMDAIRHANLGGTAAQGGVLLLVGDDHGAKSSTVACYSDYNFVSASIPLFSPSNAQEVLDYGLYALELSRFSGCVTGMKLVTDVIEGGRSVYVAPDSPVIQRPELGDATIHAEASFVPVLEQERRLFHDRLDRVLAFARANKLNQIIKPQSPRGADTKLGIISCGKSWQDLLQGLASLGYEEGNLGQLPVRLLKLGMIWPLDDQIVHAFAEGLETIIVVEEKRPLIEDQLRSILYDAHTRPRIIGKFFDSRGYSPYQGEVAFPNIGELNPNIVSRVVSRVAIEIDPQCGVLKRNEPDVMAIGSQVQRPPAFCSGCPHGRSTQLPDGSRALAGIGCHSMAAFDPTANTNSMSHMGGEGAMWLGQSAFTEEPHVFANMGDGTYFHSGYLAIRAAIAAGVTITYKLLHNGFVSMTGGQPIDGEVTPESMVRQMLAEGVRHIAMVTDDLDKYGEFQTSETVSLHERRELNTVQKRLREISGVTVIIYDQPCATERRRLRKRGQWEDPDRRVFINAAVCEGCGDCSSVSKCMSIEPLETPLGRKRQINQSSCNKDFSCVEGFCPSFITLEGATLRTSSDSIPLEDFDISQIPDPERPVIEASHAVLVSGIGGTGVVTVGQTLAVAGHLDGLYTSNLDVTGLAQKYGAVHSHIKFAHSPDALFSTRIADGEAQAILACDLVTGASTESISRLALDSGQIISDRTLVPTSEFSRNPDWTADASELTEILEHAAGENALVLDFQGIATQAFGDGVFANMMIVGCAWQRGTIPVSEQAMLRAIELNGVKPDLNKRAFSFGRLLAHDPTRVDELRTGPARVIKIEASESFSDIVTSRAEMLIDYQSEAYANRFRATVERVDAAVRNTGLSSAIPTAVAKYYFKLLSHKDSWEVARLYAKQDFRDQLEQNFEGNFKIRFHIGMWPFARFNTATGKVEKGEVGSWVLLVFRIMAKFRWLRGSMLDPFRNTAEAQMARQALADYESDIEFALNNLSSETSEVLLELLNQPEYIRGFGHVRKAHFDRVSKQRERLRAQVADPGQLLFAEVS